MKFDTRDPVSAVPQPPTAPPVGQPLVEIAEKIINELEIAELEPGEPSPFAPPHLLSEDLRSQGAYDPGFRDDLSERIYAAFHCLKRCGAKRVTSRIADALSRTGQRRGKTKAEAKWIYSDVNERVKEYQTWRKKALKNVDPKSLAERSVEERLNDWRDFLVGKWTFFYRSELSRRSSAAP